MTEKCGGELARSPRSLLPAKTSAQEAAMNQSTPVRKLKIDRELPNAESAPSLPPEQRVAATAPKRKFPAKRHTWLLIGIVALIGIAIYGWYYWTIARFEESTDDAYVEADATVVAPKVGGYLRDVLVADNQPVKAGQLLAKIDDRDFLTALDQARANVQAAQADVENLNAGIAQQQAVISQVRATVTVDTASLTFMQQDNDRYATLADKGAGSVQMAQQALSRRDVARATLQRDAAAVEAAERQSDVLKAQLAKAGAVLAQDRALQRQAELNLDYTNITAPINGTVGNRSLRVGQLVQAGTQLMALVPLNDVYVVANFKETQLTDVRAGQPVSIAVDTFPGVAVRGRVDSVAPASGQQFALLPPDNATGNFTKIVQRIPVKITLDDGPLAGQLRPGMSVIPTIETRPMAPDQVRHTAQQ
jgi:membrane fusion protein (multidrug efflux system)